MKVSFKDISIENFLSIDKIMLNFKDGVTSLQGKNLTDHYSESNGSGKSSIIEAVIWSLTGSTTRGVSSDQVINKDRISDGCEVRLEISVDNDFYEVVRTRGGSKGNSLNIKRNGESISGNTMKKSQSILEELIPLDYEDLTSCIILAQDIPGRLSSLSPAGRKSKLEKIANYEDKIESIKERVSSKLKDVTTQITKLETQIEYRSGEYKDKLIKGVDDNRKLLKENHDLVDTIEERNQAIRRYNETLEINKKEAREFKKRSEVKLEKFSSELKTKEDELSQILQDINKCYMDEMSINGNVNLKSSIIKSKRDRIKSLAGGICPSCKKPLDNQDEILSLSKKLEDEIRDEEKELFSLNESLSAIAETKVSYTDKQEVLKEEIRSIKDEMRSLQSKMNEMEKILNENPKPEGTYVDMREKFEKLIEEGELEISNLDKEVENMNSQLEVLKEKKDRLNKINSDISRGSFRNFLLDKTMKNFNYLLSQISLELMKDEPVVLQFDGNKIEIIYNDRCYEQMSSGEKKRIDIALELTVRKYKSLVSGINFDLLVMDETFDGLDKVGIDNLFNAVEASGTTEKFIVISHREDACLNYDHKIVVVKENGFSRILSEE